MSLASSDTNRSAVRLLDQPAVREVVPRDPRYSARWHTHDYPGVFAKWNYHPEYEIHLVRETWGRYIVGNGIGDFSPGQLVLIGPNLPHNWISDIPHDRVVPGRDVVFQFLDSWVDRCAALLPELTEIRPLLARASRGIEFAGATAQCAAAELEAIGRSEGAARLTHIFGMFQVLVAAAPHECRVLSDEDVPDLDDPYTAEVMNSAIEYIFDNLSSRVSLSRAATIVGMSESAFSRYFKHASGQTFSDMVRKLRLARACRLLRLTTKPVASIAREAGYSNLSNFNRQFRREYGSTPSQYRRLRWTAHG